jgi:hypothetical protein
MMCYNTRNLSDLSNSLSNDLTGGKRASHSRSHVSASDDLIAHGVKRFRKTAADARALNAAIVLVLPNPRGTTLFPARLYCPCGFAK